MISGCLQFSGMDLNLWSWNECTNFKLIIDLNIGITVVRLIQMYDLSYIRKDISYVEVQFHIRGWSHRRSESWSVSWSVIKSQRTFRN
jgi:hypothetical protein